MTEGVGPRRVAMFATCLVDALFPDAGRATVSLLERLGQPVEFPLEQTCCGQMHANSGYFQVDLVRRYVDVFSGYDAIVAPSGSCVASIRDQHPMISRAAGDPALAARAEAVGSKTYELSQFLIDVLGIDDVGAYFPHRVTYHPTCHSARLLGVGDATVPAAAKRARASTWWSCRARTSAAGSAARSRSRIADTSAAMLADKMEAVLDTGAEVLCAGDRSCLMHIGGGLRAEPRRRAHAPPRRDPREHRGRPSIRASVHRHGERLGMSAGETIWTDDPPFPEHARRAVNDAQLRRNIRNATTTIRASGARAWSTRRPTGSSCATPARRSRTTCCATSTDTCEQFEAAVDERGGARPLGARRGRGERRSSTSLVKATGETEVVKVKSMATDEIGLNEALAEHGIDAIETDLAELIIQLGRRPADRTSSSPRSTGTAPRSASSSCREMADAPSRLSDDPRALARGVSRATCGGSSSRPRSRSAAPTSRVAETGTLCVVESEGNGRMCTTLPQVLISVMGIEKLVPTFADLEVFLQLLPRSSTGERMNPYTSLWTGVTPGDGPQELHVVLLDNGRTHVLRDEVGRQALHCIRCAPA